MSIYRKIMELTGMDGSPPHAPTLRTGPEELTTVWANLNDGFELWVGWPDKWKHYVPHEEVGALFWWLLWRYYGQARWFGLRRPIYYWALRRSIRGSFKSFKKRGASRTDFHDINLNDEPYKAFEEWKERHPL